jgi:hypothetical protein
MPVGQSTITQEIDAVTQQMSLDISIDDFAAHRDALIQQLAAQYSVHSSLLTVAVQPGSVQITITIATTNGTGSALNVSSIVKAINSTTDEAFATSFGEVMNTTVRVTSLPPQRSMVSIEATVSCPRGKWCNAGLVVDCPLNSYNPLLDQYFATACILCPPNSITLHKASTERGDCRCDAGFYDVNASQAIDDDLFRRTNLTGEPKSMMAAVVQCETCPIGTACISRGSTLEQLPLLKGYYRLDNTTVDVRICPDARKNCSTSFGTLKCESSSGCQGGTGDPCAAGLTGTYCALCDRSGDELVFYQPASSTGIAQCRSCGNTLSQTIGIAVGLVAAAILLIALLRYSFLKLPVTVARRLRSLNSTLTPKNKGKIIFGSYQIITKIPVVYEVPIPAEVSAFLESMSVFITFGMQDIATTPLECLGMSGYSNRLLFWMLVPPVLVLVMVFGVLVASILKRYKKEEGERRLTTQPRRSKNKKDGGRFTGKSMSRLTGRRTNNSLAGKSIAERTLTRQKAERTLTRQKEHIHGAAFHLSDAVAANQEVRQPTLFEKLLPQVLTLLFILYPVVTNNAFDGFPCYTFENGRGWLVADVSIECGTDEHTSVARTAWIAVLVYPVGIWIFCFVLLWKCSSSIVAGKETSLSRAIGFLHKEYGVQCFWWELMEMLRKFLLYALSAHPTAYLLTGTRMHVRVFAALACLLP